MSNETYVTLVGSLYQDPELRQVGNGQVANLTVVVNARKFNRDTNEWEKKPGKFWRCQAWDQGKLQLAQNVAAELRDKDSVIVYGEIVTREYEQDGKKRTADEVRIETIGKDLRWAGQQSQQGGWGQQQSQGAQNVAAQLGGQQQGGWGAPSGGSGGWPAADPTNPPF